MKMEGFVSAASAVLDAVANARIPFNSYVRDPRCGVADLELLPKDVLPWIDPDEGPRIKALGNVSLRELAQEDKITIADVSSTRLALEYKGCGAVLKELLRADLDRDGLEEILIQYYIYAIGGSFGASFIGVLRRSSPDAMFEFVPNYRSP